MVYFENEVGERLPERYIEIALDVIEASLLYVKCEYECEINVVFTDNEGIKAINKEYRAIDAPTDVLSFPLLSFETPGDFSFVEDNSIDNFNHDTGELMLGDIIINIDRVFEQAKQYGHTRRREVAFLIAHSMLHLSGYDHIDDEERKDMEKRQDEILNMKGYTRDNEEE